MRTVGVIAEYNPFHNGHLHQLKQIRGALGDDTAVIAIMSGDWTQRGEPALLDKWSRTRSALAAGVNLLIELPTIFATGSAGYFASGAVRALSATGVCNHLCFGSEAGRIDELRILASLILTEPPTLSGLLQNQLRLGKRGGAAWSSTIGEYLSHHGQVDGLKADRAREILTGSNNWLGIEYLKAIESELNGKMKATTFLREGDDYSSSTIGDLGADEVRKPSANAIREFSRHSQSSRRTTDFVKMLQECVPTGSAAQILQARRGGELLIPGSAGLLAYSKIRSELSCELTKFDGCESDLVNRLKQTVDNLSPAQRKVKPSDFWDEILNRTSGRNFTRAKVQRVLTSIILGIHRSDRADALKSGPQYLRILGFDKKGRYLLKLMRKHARLPLISRVSDFLEYSDIGNPFTTQYLLDNRASDIRSALCGNNPANDFDTNVVIL